MGSEHLLAERITSILIKFNAGEKCDLYELASEFSVSLRTIQRDINERLAFLPLIKEGSIVYIEPSSLGRLSTKDIRNFAQICGINELFPSLDNSFVTELLSNTYNSNYLIKGHHYESDANIKPLLEKLNLLIEKSLEVEFFYKGKSYEGVQPYKLVNSKGIWYLVAVDSDKVKTFHLTKIRSLFQQGGSFSKDSAIEDMIAKEDSIYFGKDKTEVVLKVSSQVAHYFKRRDLLPNQVIEKELETGELIVSSKVSSETQIIPLIKYWIPNLEVISPQVIRDEIRQQCTDFLST